MTAVVRGISAECTTAVQSAPPHGTTCQQGWDTFLAWRAVTYDMGSL